jgi:hypothetical protein
VAILSFTGSGDYDQAKQAERDYCERVDLGIHRHFNTDINCNENDGE